jgi:hypothetical protein
VAFDLQAPPRTLYPAWTPLRATLPGERETSAQRAERLQWEEDRRRRAAALVQALEVAWEVWREWRLFYAHVPALVAVLDIHGPTDNGWGVVCAGCPGDYYGDGVDWPCTTFQAIEAA